MSLPWSEVAPLGTSALSLILCVWKTSLSCIYYFQAGLLKFLIIARTGKKKKRLLICLFCSLLALEKYSKNIWYKPRPLLIRNLSTDADKDRFVVEHIHRIYTVYIIDGHDRSNQGFYPCRNQINFHVMLLKKSLSFKECNIFFADVVESVALLCAGGSRAQTTLCTWRRSWQ